MNDGSSGFRSETWVYDLSDNTWTNKAPAAAAANGAALYDGPSARWGPPMTSLGGDKVLLFGGDDGSGGCYGDTWIYDLSDNTWTDQAPATAAANGAALYDGPSARCGAAMAALGGDEVLLFGGDDGSGGYYNDTWIYDFSDNTWTQVAQVPGVPSYRAAASTAPSARADHAMASLGGDEALLFGGYDGISANNETWVYDLIDNTWTRQDPVTAAANGAALYDGPSSRAGHALVSLGRDQVFLFGGWDASGSISETWLVIVSTVCSRLYLPLVFK